MAEDTLMSTNQRIDVERNLPAYPRSGYACPAQVFGG